jgi:hypothetical protein
VTWPFQPQTYTRHPLPGDYILDRTGVSWSVNRSLANGAVARLTEGGASKVAARDAVVKSARTDSTDAWETAGAGEFRLLEACR